MKKLSLLVTATTLCLLHFTAYSQNDSTRLDVGGVVLKRPFTQNVSIKGEDLEKMPFANLSEAIGAWLYGSYTNPAYITYVVDGNIASDVNSYSIHDIEEVVLVQNAAALSNLGGSQPQMVVITTRKGKGRSGLQGAAQTFFVRSPQSTTPLYHQYYIGAYQNLEKVSFGLSANYLRDVEPTWNINGTHVITPDHMDRWRLNGYFSWRPDRKNTIEANVGFTPQTIGSEFEYLTGSASNPYKYYTMQHEHTNLLLPRVRWHGEWVPGLRYDLEAGLVTELQKGNAWHLSAPVDTTKDRWYQEKQATAHSDHWYVRQRVSYQVQAGGWSIEPSFNARYEHFKFGFSQTTLNELGPNAGPGPINPSSNPSSSGYWSSFGANLYLLTPAVDISYKRGFDIQGGFVANVSHIEGNPQGVKRVYPFVSTTVDLLGLGQGHTEQHSSLKLFGSYAQRASFFVNDFMLNDLSGISSVFVNTSGLGPVFGSNTGAIPISPVVGNIKYFWIWQTGAAFTSKDNRWQLSYNLERSNFLTVGLLPYSSGYSYVYSEWKSLRHFLGLNVRIVDKGVFSWQSGLTTTVIRNKTNAYLESYVFPPLGEHMRGNDKPSWTGGWTHRLRYKDFSAGVDMLYHFNKEINFITPAGDLTYSRANTFVIQNIYIAYKLHLPGKTGIEIYADSRGLVRSDKSIGQDARRYYGVGGKISI
ncbi:MAG: hypothetical protein J0H74_28040 [Chitinophagaceae bacterium]|nr:hypothetical protein [Chitinophagaceae bacterium]